MTIIEKVGKFFTKLQSLPEGQKKIILWTIVTIVAAIMGYFWIKGATKTFSEFGKGIQSIEIPQLDTSNMPSLDILETTTPSNIE